MTADTRIYLDNNATTKPAPLVVDAMREMLTDCWGNPSSVHRFGQLARQRVELARESVAKLIGCADRELLFTSGGTEANNLALRGFLSATPKAENAGQGSGAGQGGGAGRRVLITTPIEHAAIREPAEALAEQGVEVIRLPVGLQGEVEPASLETALQELLQGDAAKEIDDQGDNQGDVRGNAHGGGGAAVAIDRVVVSIQWANNETGVILPVAAYARIVRTAREQLRNRGQRTKLFFHVDGTQAVGKLPVDVAEQGMDGMTLAAHKFHGPKGVGALYLRRGVRLRPQQTGGPQERERRGGTENTPGIVGMGIAAELAARFVAEGEGIESLRALRDRLERGILEHCPGAVVNGQGQARLWNTTNIGFPRLESEAILLGLSERGVYASAGAACSSGSLEPSPVLLAMGIPEPIAHGSVRFSLSRDSTEAEVDEAIHVVSDVIERLSKTLPI